MLFGTNKSRANKNIAPFIYTLYFFFGSGAGSCAGGGGGGGACATGGGACVGSGAGGGDCAGGISVKSFMKLASSPVMPVVFFKLFSFSQLRPGNFFGLPLALRPNGVFAVPSSFLP